MKRPSNCKQAERQMISFVQNGTLEIDAQGRIWRLKDGRGRPIGRRRAESENTYGYLQVFVRTGSGHRPNCFAHRLVWQHLHGDIPDGFCINHVNGVKNDNRPENLELATYSENMRHAFRLGLNRQDGDRNGAAKLTNEQVAEIRSLYATRRYRGLDLAGMYGVSRATISLIIRGKRYPNQGGPKVGNQAGTAYLWRVRDSATGQFAGSTMPSGG